MDPTAFKRLFVAAVFAVTCGSIGCSDPPSDESPPLIPIEGRLNAGKTPLENVMVLFVPVNGGLKATGLSDNLGRYVARSENSSPGLAAGEYIVTLNRPRILQAKDKTARSLNRFQAAESSPIRATVASDTKTIDIDIEDFGESQ